MKITKEKLRAMIIEALNEVSPAWREDSDRRFDVDATPVGHGHYGALNPDKLKPSEVEGAIDERAEAEFKHHAISEFDRIFKTDFYKQKLADAGGQFDFVADNTITRALSGDIMHGLLHEMMQMYIFEIFKEKRMEQPEYDLWTNIMETIVYYLQNGLGGTNPKPFGRWITERMAETTELPKVIDGDELYDLFLNVFTSGTRDRAGHNQIEEIPAKLRTPFLRDIQKALRKKGEVKPQEAFTQAVSFFINDIHKGGNAKTFLYDADGNDISDQVMSFYNSLKRKVEQLKKKYPDVKAESVKRDVLRNALRKAIIECGMDDVMPYSDDEEMGMEQDDHDDESWADEDRPFDAPDEEHPGYMLLGNLKKLAVKSAELADLATPWDDAEPWVESKINSAAQHIDAIHDYIMYSVLDQDFDAEGHEDMMHECGEMMGDMMTEPAGRNFGDGGSATMARGQLFQIAKRAQSLSDRLTDTDTLPEWLQSKVAMAYQSISAVSDYLDYKMARNDMGDPVYEGILSTVKGAFTGAGKKADAVFQMIDKNSSLKNTMYNDFLVDRSKPKKSIEMHMSLNQGTYDKLFDKAGIADESREEVEELLVPKLITLMKSWDSNRMSN